MTGPASDNYKDSAPARADLNGAQRKQPGLIPCLLLLGGLTGLLFIVFSLLILMEQARISQVANEARERLLPALYKRQNSVLCREKFSRHAEIIFNTQNPLIRRNNLFAAKYLVEEAEEKFSPRIQAIFTRAYQGVKIIHDIRSRQDELSDLIQYLGKIAEIELRVVLPDESGVIWDAGRAIAYSSLAEPVYAMRTIAFSAPHVSNEKELNSLLERLDKVRADLASGLSSGVEDNDSARLLMILKKTRTMALLKRAVLLMDMENRIIRRETLEGLDQAFAALSEREAATAEEELDSIVNLAESARSLVLLAFGAFLLAAAAVFYFTRRDIVSPIMNMARLVGRIYSERRRIPAPPARIREMNAMARAVNQFGLVLEKNVERAEQLEKEVARRVKIGQELERAKLEAERANNSKSEFLASMSHDIRTPMNSIMAMAELLEESRLTLEQRQYVELLANSGEILLNIINDVLDLSKVEAGQIELERVDFDLSEVFEKTCKIMAMRAQAKGLDFHCRIAPDTPFMVKGDPTRLRQVLDNLISNAIKFTHAGGVVIQVERGNSSARNIRLHFSIADTGIGIARDKQNKIFESFTQSDASTTRKYGGTGLGLAICKKLTSLMNGEIWVESEPNDGSVFHFTAEFDRSETEPAPRALSDAYAGFKVMNFDHDEFDRRAAGEIFARFGMLQYEADSIQAGLDEMNAAAMSGTPFELVLVDSRLPGFSKLIAKLFELQPRPGLIIMNIHGGRAVTSIPPLNRDQAVFMLKPATGRDLETAVIKALSQERGQPPAPRPAPRESRENISSLRILLADDNPGNRDIIRLYLKSFSCALDMAENGIQAVEKYQAEPYDLVFMDLDMPLMDGFQAAETIRAWEKSRKLKPAPIIALTAHAFQEHKHKCLDAGCSGFITKPFDKDRIKNTLIEIAQNLGIKTSRDNGEPGQWRIPARLSSDQDADSPDSITARFLDRTGKDLESIRPDVDNGRLEQIFRFAHNLKGSAGTHGFSELSRFGESIQSLAEKSLFAQLKEELIRLETYLKELAV